MAKRSGPVSGTGIDVEKTTLGKMLKSQRLVVPGFQREYSWKPPRVRKLFSDFHAAMTKGQSSYFLGTVALQDTHPPGLIDGQQRLATTCIFLAAVRDAYLELGAEAEADSITNDFLFTYDRVAKESLPRLLLNIDDREYIKNAVLVEPANRTTNDLPKDVHSHRLIDKAFAVSQEWVKKITAPADTPARKTEALNVWVDFIEQKAVLVALTPANLSQAYQMFITLNDRAQRTTQADLIKSHLFQEVSEGETASARLTEASSKWAAARRMVDTGSVRGDDDPILTYLHYLCVVRTGPVTLDGLFDVVEGNISGRNQALQFLEAISAYAKPYRAAIGNHPEFWEAKNRELRRCVDNVVKSMQIKSPIPLVMAIGVKFTDREIKLALRAIEAWSARFLITGSHRTGQAERHFGLLAHRVHKGEITTAEQLAREAETIVAADARFVEKFRIKTLSNERQARYVLLELEAQRRAEGGDAFVTAIDEPDRLNLEHILPKSKDWKANYPSFSDDERDASVSKIGNLALLKREKNCALNDAAFSTKLPVLASSNIKTTEIAASFVRGGQWTPQSIDERQAWLADIALKRWPLFADLVANERRRRQ
jgi:Protein of unknown function DUF262/Protein of unknown function (DUF1524)